MEMSKEHLWYNLIPERDRQVVDAAAKWLRPVPWQWFVTLTLPWNVRSETADAKLKEWLNLIERTMRPGSALLSARNASHILTGWRCPGISTSW